MAAPGLGLVVDASVAMTWAFEDESDAFTLGVLRQAQSQSIYVPALFWFEIGNGIVVAQRRGRLAETGRLRFEQLLDEIEIDTSPVEPPIVFGRVLALSHAHGLTAYDASYLELAMRLNARLATLDTALIEAAPRAGVRLFTISNGD